MERLTQFDGQVIYWPTLEDASKLLPLSDGEYKTLYLFEARRRNGMTSPTVRQVRKYLDHKSVGSVHPIIHSLVEKGYLSEEVVDNSDLEPGKAPYVESRGRTIIVNFETVIRKSNAPISVPDKEGLTCPKKA